MGNLIDADALMKDVRENSESYFADDFAEFWVNRQPTVDAIPTEWIRAQMCEYPGMESAMWSKLLRIWKREADT